MVTATTGKNYIKVGIKTFEYTLILILVSFILSCIHMNINLQ